MNPTDRTIALAAGLFVGMLVCLEVGYRIGRSYTRAHPDLPQEGVGAMESATFALFGLILAFSFSGATSRLDVRRQLIVHEANAIGTAYLRVDLLPSNDQPAVRQLFQKYLDARLRMYAQLPNMAAAEQELARAQAIQRDIWSHVVDASRRDPTGNAAKLLLPALNDMIDVTTTRNVALHTRLPSLILTLLIFLALMSGLLAGHAMAKRQRRGWLHEVLYATFVAITIYSVLDLDNPRAGLIRLDVADRAIVELRNSIR
jgi:hypothetical protein